MKGSSEAGDVLFLPLHGLLEKATGLDQLRPENVGLIQ